MESQQMRGYLRDEEKIQDIRFLRAFIRRLTDTAPPKHLSPRCLFLPAISATRSPMLECDYNMHKSNSTYFTDLDMSRGNISLALFRKPFNPFPGPNHFIMILGGANCVWRKEIAPYEAYELWTRVLTWDEKWIYLVSHFVKAGKFVPSEYAMQPGSTAKKSRSRGNTVNDPQKAVFASSIARYVFKNGRKTVPPEKALLECGLLPGDEAELVEVERLRLKWLPVAQLKSGWDAVHKLVFLATAMKERLTKSKYEFKVPY
ncbi:capsule polysaccharide biosynthesis protein [Colletotrichum asianum]|uniref:Capsule polysaccharide biosynthesis protein n=1 Tax=Colletotrichum asianum TaxID=702518 RepID=A0A8H3ZUC3_9PEZI|nr:capsule polysaccharide biosynthesis protein [Colletotrichum asianum]